MSRETEKASMEVAFEYAWCRSRDVERELPARDRWREHAPIEHRDLSADRLVWLDPQNRAHVHARLTLSPVEASELRLLANAMRMPLRTVVAWFVEVSRAFPPVRADRLARFLAVVQRLHGRLGDAEFTPADDAEDRAAVRAWRESDRADGIRWTKCAELSESEAPDVRRG